MRRLIPLGVFAVLLLHGALLGLTDDEAYYWVLAQRPALGYAFHPPGVAWAILASQKLFGWLFGANSSFVVRLPAAAFASGVVALGLEWMILAGAPARGLGRGALVLLSFAGFFAAAWMMVPDLPLFFGWALAFVTVWKIAFGARVGAREYVLLAVGVWFALIAKYSGVGVAGSASLAVLLWAPRERRVRACVAIGLGAAAAAVPVLAWNAQNDWSSLLYQLRDRHGARVFSATRYARFWVIELALAGPPLVAWAWLSFRRRHERVSRYVWVWALPAALVYCVQPAWSDFKPHWAFIVWLPFALELGWVWARDSSSRFARAQVAYGVPVAVLALVLCHVPAGMWVIEKVRGVDRVDPKLDVTNDMYGWRGLDEYLRGFDGAHALPVVGSRYQTSSQAAFALGDSARVGFLPRDQKQRAEWPDLGISESQGPEWPKLLKPVLFVADNRYDAGPAFRDASCAKLGRLEGKRAEWTVKWIDVWRCEPALRPVTNSSKFRTL